MSLSMTPELLMKIQDRGENAYPEEAAGFLLGLEGVDRTVKDILQAENSSEDGVRHNRYLISPEDYLRAELQAGENAMEVIGIYHSHPDHPERPSEIDRDWAQPSLSYLITSIRQGSAATSRSWRLLDDRSGFFEEEIRIT